MTFYCGFSDLSGKKYDIEIHSDNGDAREINIMMGSTPLTISSTSNGLLSPIKSRSATINVVTREWYMELYEPVSRGTWVKVYETDTPSNVIFFGWLTPCSYDQTWTYMDTITLEAVDALSTCKDYKWVHNYRYNTFQEIVLSILKSAGYRRTIYIPQTYSYDFDELLASSGNFIDDDEAHTPWTEYEVLEEICKFMGWSKGNYVSAFFHIVPWKAYCITLSAPKEHVLYERNARRAVCIVNLVYFSGNGNPSTFCTHILARKVIHLKWTVLYVKRLPLPQKFFWLKTKGYLHGNLCKVN